MEPANSAGSLLSDILEIGFLVVVMLAFSGVVLFFSAPETLFEFVGWIIRNFGAAWRGEAHEPIGLRVAGFSLLLAGGLIAAYGVALAFSIWGGSSTSKVFFVAVVLGLGVAVSVWGVRLLQRGTHVGEEAEESPEPPAI